MLKSMTGYGLASSETDKMAVTVEIKSLNSKFLDINLKTPKEYNDKELEIRNLIASTLERGKLGLSIEINQKGDVKPKVSINRELVKCYYEDLRQTATMVGASDSDLLKVALQMPKAINAGSENEDTTKEWELVLKVFKEAIAKCEEFRLNEGKALESKLEDYIGNIGEQLKKIDEADPQRIKSVKERIKNHIAELQLGEQVDQNRFEQELIYYIEKLDINEEKVRLRSHLQYFLETMKSKDANGKKLGFIAQEIGREINTIGSKANDAVMQRFVVEMKEELEKIKEQSLNIL
jgi:uncharacterized protein (TIGR00255 family)